MRLFSAPEIFIPHADGTKKPAPESRDDLWHRFLERVSWMGIMSAKIFYVLDGSRVWRIKPKPHRFAYIQTQTQFDVGSRAHS